MTDRLGMKKRPPGEIAVRCPEGEGLALGSDQTAVPLDYALLGA
jgi:hypothetical protein